MTAPLIFEKEVTVTPDLCDCKAGFAPLAAFTVFQGIATEHAELLGIGGFAMAARGEFWLTAHTRVDFLAPALLMQKLTARTWAEAYNPSALRCYRSYELCRGETVIALGRTEWAVLGPEQKLVTIGDSGFPKDYPAPDKSAIAERPKRFRDDFTEEERYAAYAVRSTDIDFGRHMNNVAYVRLLLDSYSSRELASGRIRSIEIHYSSSALEGEELTLYRKTDGNTQRFCIRRPDGKAAALAMVTLREA